MLVSFKKFNLNKQICMSRRRLQKVDFVEAIRNCQKTTKTHGNNYTKCEKAFKLIVTFTKISLQY